MYFHSYYFDHREGVDDVLIIQLIHRSLPIKTQTPRRGTGCLCFSSPEEVVTILISIRPG
jgi:hypothetical protein